MNEQPSRDTDSPDEGAPAPTEHARSSRAVGLILVIGLLVLMGVAAWYFAYERPRRSEADRVAREELRESGALVLPDPQTDEIQVAISKQDISDEQIQQLSSLEHLTRLDLSGCRLEDAQLNQLDADLISLVLNDTPIGDEGLEAVQSMDRLRALYLQNTNVGDEGLAVIGGVNQLTNLDLTNTQITDAGLVHLQGLDRLKYVTLSQTEITDAGLEHLHVLSDLGRVDLHGCPVTEEGVKKLTAAIPGLSVHQ